MSYWRDSILVGLVLVVAFSVGYAIQFLPVTSSLKIFAYCVYGVFIVGVVLHRYYTNWETYAERRALNSISIIGWLFVGKALSSQIFSSDVFASTDFQSFFLVEVMTTANPETDLAFAVIGCLLCVIAPYLIRNRMQGVSNRVADSYISQLLPHTRTTDTYEGHDTYDPDFPPLIDTWVGRESELQLAIEMGKGVIAITGIGGQGKSLLAAKIREEYLNNEGVSLFWDWRDCREQANRFRTQLVSVIEHYTEREYAIGNESVKWLTTFFFRKLGNKRAIIVFDNVDYYVDIGRSRFISDVSIFLEEVLRIDTQALIIFTCRHRISYPSTRFREVYLTGLSFEETFRLFQEKLSRPITADLSAVIKRCHILTDGHPLWLSLLASHLERRPSYAQQVVDNLEAGKDENQATSILRAIWDSLTKEQTIILRTMAELPRPMTVDRLYEYSGIEHHNRFDKAFKTLRGISLVTEKGSNESNNGLFDLHPLVRAFVRTEYRHSTNRTEIVSRLLNSCSKILVRLKSDGEIVTIELLQESIVYSELLIENGKIDSAIETLVNDFDPIIARGLHEEFIRVANLILDRAGWEELESMNSREFDRLIRHLCKTLAEIEGGDSAANILHEYEKIVPKNTARFVGLCELASYVYWVVNDHETSLTWSERGRNLKDSEGIDTEFECGNNMALAFRDSGDVDKALDIFLNGATVDELVIDEHLQSGRNASYYGNIGRCLALKGHTKEALILYSKSFQLLQLEADASNMINRGYAGLWIGELLESQESFGESAKYYKYACEIWEKRAPAKVSEPFNKLTSLNESVDAEGSELSVWCVDWSESYLKKMEVTV